MSLYQISVKKPGGGLKPLSDYRGKLLLIVNVASKCGFTPQYAGLEALYRAHRAQGFEVLGFPCNQFGAQEPGNAEEIASFCSLTYDVSFPIFGKIDVNGANADPLYALLKAAKPGLFGSKAIKWNFTKFLVDREGNVGARFGPRVKPEALEGEIAKRL